MVVVVHKPLVLLDDSGGELPQAQGCLVVAVVLTLVVVVAQEAMAGVTTMESHHCWFKKPEMN